MQGFGRLTGCVSKTSRPPHQLVTTEHARPHTLDVSYRRSGTANDGLISSFIRTFILDLHGPLWVVLHNNVYLWPQELIQVRPERLVPLAPRCCSQHIGVQSVNSRALASARF